MDEESKRRSRKGGKDPLFLSLPFKALYFAFVRP